MAAAAAKVVAAVVLVLLASSRGAAGQDGSVALLGVPLDTLRFPPLFFELVAAAVAAEPGDGAGPEAPFGFRRNAAALSVSFDCVGPYASNGRRYTNSWGEPVTPVLPHLRTDDAIVLCTASGLARITSYFGSDGVYQLLAAGPAGVHLPRDGNATCAGLRGEALWSAPACAGLAAATRRINDHLRRDGMNQDGAAGVPPGAPPKPFADAVTGYAPVNWPGRVSQLTRWVPLEEDVHGTGEFVVQKVLAPQTAAAWPFLVPRATLDAISAPTPYPHAAAYRPDFRCPPERALRHNGSGFPFSADPDNLCGLAADVMAATANLTVARAAMVRLFDNKGPSIARYPLVLAATTNASLADYLTWEYLLNSAAWDATTVVWREKILHDAVRPASLLPSILADDPRGAAFTPSIRTMAHQEYPSQSAAICSLVMGLIGTLSEGKPFPLAVPLSAGALAPGVPSANLTLDWDGPAAVSRACGDSRVWGGLHFPAAVATGARLGAEVAAAAIRVVACQAPGTPGLPPCGGALGGKGEERGEDSGDASGYGGLGVGVADEEPAEWSEEAVVPTSDF